LAGVSALLIGGLSTGVYWIHTSLPRAFERIQVNGIAAPVEVLRDNHWVPHIFARTPEDGAFALGYVHAQDRLWQMESMRRLGAGRLAEVVGAAGLPSDRFMRTLGLYRLAEAQVDLLSEDARRTLDAYAAGVNAWIEHRDGALPPEFIALGLEPEPWRPADSLVWVRIMALRLAGNRRTELLRARLQSRLTDEQIAELWPPYPGDQPVTIERSDGVSLGLPLGRLTIPEPPALQMPRGASNVWVVGGSETSTGKPLLANDPHLGFAAPILWYLVRISTPELELVGATAPGFPFVILGHNRHIAWGMSNTGSDFEDLFVERIDPTNPARHLAPNGPLAFAIREELIKVEDAEDVVLIVRESRHGPIISDVVGNLSEASAGSDAVEPEKHEKEKHEEVLALAATYLRDDDRTAEAAYRLSRARDWDEFTAAVEDFHSPQANLMYADVNGNIGFIAPGRVPVRRSGRGAAPSAGWTGETDWTGFVPFEDLPRDYNPRSGRLVNANNKVVSESYPWYLGSGWDEGYRARRIDDLLVAEAPHTPESNAAIQLDIVSLMARHLLPIMLERLPDRERHRRVTGMLRAWSGEMSRTRPEPLIFAAWMREFNRAVYADELGSLAREYIGYRPRFITFVLKDRPKWCDDIATQGVEDCASRLETALDAALEDLSDRFGRDPGTWRWGDAHRAEFNHLMFGHLPVLRTIANLNVATDGGFYTVNRGAGHLGDPEQPFAHVHGAGFRAVYDLSDLSRSQFIIATGQSGNPLSPHYGDLLRTWRDGGWIRLGQSRESLEREAVGRLTLLVD
jgi:penicillin amidase